MINYLKLFVFFFLGFGVLLSLGIFGLKIIFYDKLDGKLITLGPDKGNTITKPVSPGGLKVSNLNIEILNNKKALIEEKKIRSYPDKPEPLPMEIGENKNDEKKIVNRNLIKKENFKVKDINKIIKPIIKPKSIKKTKIISGLYRVQFGSFRNLDKAQMAMKTMKKKYINLLSEKKLEIFTYENSNKIIFHRVWTLPMTKFDGLKLCDQFKQKNIVCILQVSK